MKSVCLFLSIVLCLSLISCAFGDITDPLGDDYEVPQEWQPILSEEEALEKYGLGDYRDTYDLQAIRLRECYDYCIYFRGNLKDPTKLELGSYNTLLRYDLRTGEILPACRDSACTHLNASCPFYLKNTARYLIHGDIMYYMTLKVTDDGNVDTSKPGGIYRYDMKSFECKLLTRIDTGVNGFFNYYKGKIYYVQNEYRDKETNEYTEYIWSCDAKTGKTEKLFAYEENGNLEDRGRKPMLIDEKGRLLFINFIEFDTTDMDEIATLSFEYAELKKNAEIVEVVSGRFNFNYTASYRTRQYSNGRLYFNGRCIEEKIPYHYNGKDDYRLLGNYTIDYVDFNTGTFGRLMSNTIAGFCIAGDYLYYVPYDPKVIEYENGDTSVMWSHSRVVQFNLKTREEREFPVPDLCEIGGVSMYYFRGRLFTSLTNYGDDKTGVDSVELDLLTGEYRFIPLKMMIY